MFWDGLRLRLRATDRVLAVLKPDVEFPKLFRVHVGPDHVTDLLNLPRAREAAVLLALRVLEHEGVHHRARTRRNGAEVAPASLDEAP